ncbi:transcription antitermination factor NusB [Desmospora profundinema]|uniref:Transcription antitermination protein NusB n=1 Tax=Desmospora profundinema TaxID=1571184 RepID=A0ABU1IKJ2_9BACL|nr:transcription antitermination factor NusB [Desmospora profundinema]MDR6224649.1 N utilization substance protein B [Desmospora profundinema]
MSRRKVREKALQALYQLQLNKQDKEEWLRREDRKLADPIDPRDREFFGRLVQGVIQNQEQLDQQIEGYLKKDWTLSRLSLVDQMILRLSVYELLHEPDIPNRVSLNEAVELAKTFSGDESPKFINGVLASFLRDRQGE